MAETDATVTEVRREASAAATLRLDLGGRPFKYRPGEAVAPDGSTRRELGFHELWCGNRRRKTPGLPLPPQNLIIAT